jgi:Glycosyl transferases group 1
MLTNTVFLEANSEAFEWLAKKICTTASTNKPEAILRQIVEAARFAAVYHPGRFSDGTIENLALGIGAEIPSENIDDGRGRQDKNGYRRVLHVATDVLGVGGHTRMLYHWICNDIGSIHSVVLVDQRDVGAIPNWLSEAVKRGGGEMVVFPSETELCQKAKMLREIAKYSADLVVLHVSPFDVVPTAAFAVRDCPPVAVLNHADHLFWLGSSVVDIVINLRTAGAVHTAERRFISQNTVLPIPLVEPEMQLPRKQARQTLGIGEDQCMLLSVGRAEKYRPSGAYNFVATANKILNCHKLAHLYVVGETAAGIAPYLDCALHERLHFMGSMEDPSQYLMAADVYLESFPFGSNTALLEAAVRGLPVVPGYAPLFLLMGANNDSLLEYLSNPKSEAEYIDRIDVLIRDKVQRAELGAKLRASLLLDHTNGGWLQNLNKMYEETDGLTHDPRPIPNACLFISKEDIGLSLWRIMADGKNSSTAIPKNLSEAAYCHASFVAKEVGNYASARSNAWRAVRQNPFIWSTWRLFGITLLGKLGPTLRKMIAGV